jgi:aspartate racemase
VVKSAVSNGPASPTHDGAMPLTAAQDRIWFFQQLAPESTAYHRPVAVEFEGPLDVDALERALRWVVRRHEALRTAFPAVDGQPRPEVLPELDIGLTPETLHEADSEDVDDRVLRWVRKVSDRPFDLETGPLFRPSLLRLSSERHIFVAAMHHMVFDGWSSQILLKDLAHSYAAFRAGETPDAADLPEQYGDYARWEQQRLASREMEESVEFWRQALSDPPPPLELPADRERQARRSYRGDHLRAHYPERLWKDLRGMGADAGCTPFMTVLAGLSVLLSRYTGQTDLVVGVPVAGRDRPEFESLIGCFINTIGIRVDLSGAPSFREVLRRVRGSTLGALSHRQVPFERIVQAVRPDRSPAHSPLFQVMFNLRNYPRHPVEIPGVKTRELPLPTDAPLLDLSVEMELTPECLACGFEFDVDLFERSRIARMATHMRNILESAVSNVDQPISNLRLMDSDEHELVLNTWSGRPRPHPDDPCLHELFERSVQNGPRKTAAVESGTTRTYDQLDREANRLARHLTERGVAAGSFVGLAIERSLDALVGILAILKAGGAFVPLDPLLPQNRLAFMVRHAGIEVVLRRDEVPFAWEKGAVAGVSLRGDRERITEHGDEQVRCPATPSDPAYVIFTSGSTGDPKGVVISHRAAASFVAAATSTYELVEQDRVLQFFSLSFDASIQDIFPALAVGATLVYRDPDLPSAAEFVRFLARDRVSFATFVTAFWHHWVDALPLETTLPDTLRLVVVGGERARWGAYRKWRAIAGDRVRWLNVYGPTEATVVATSCDPSKSPVRKGSDSRGVPIGTPIANTCVRVLDAALEPVPIGIPGELCIGGYGLATGYLGDPDLTARSFVPDPFAPGGDRQLYRSGDRVQWNETGQLEFLGRQDHQIKIRGYRVELGEIEAVLESHAKVEEAAVVVTGDASLSAYVAPQRAGESDLRRFLKARLPEYMIPARFTRLERLPRTTSQKIDRAALPSPGSADSAGEVAQPRNQVDRTLVDIWEQTLGFDQIGIDDNFFDIGGHSLLAMRVFAAIEKRFGRRLPIALLFEAPTVRELSDHLSSKAQSASPSLIKMSPGREPGPALFLIHTGLGHLFGYDWLIRRLDIDRPVYGLQAKGVDGSAEIHHTVEEMATCYVDEIEALQPRGPYHLVGYSFGGLVAWEMACQLADRGQRLGLVGLIEANFNWRLLLPPEAHRDFAVSQRKRAARRLGRTALALIKRPFQVVRFGRRLFAHQDRRLIVTARQAAKRYGPRPLAGRVVDFRCEADHESRARWTKLAGWEDLAQGGVEVCLVPGAHLRMLTEPGLSIVAEKLRERLGGAESEDFM